MSGEITEPNTAPEKKRGKLRPPWKPGQSGNPGGRPKNEVSIAYWLREWGGMSGPQAAKLCSVYAKELNKLDATLPLAALVALRAWMSQINEPQPGVFGHLLDRLDGPITAKTDHGGELVIRVIREDKPTPDE